MKERSVESTFSGPIAEMWDDIFNPAAEKEVSFYLNQFKGTPLQGKTLDIGCGTGRFLLPLLKQGHQAVGIDSSDAMLDVFRRKPQAAGIEPDVRHMSFDGYPDSGPFQGIVAFYVIFYFLKTDELRAFFKKAFSLLSPGGLLLFNYYNPFEIWEPKKWGYPNTYPYEWGFGRVEYTYTPVDYIRGIAEMQEYSMVSKDGVPRFDYKTRHVRFYTMTELQLLLEDVGFSDVRTFSGLVENPVREEDLRGYSLYTTARKP